MADDPDYYAILEVAPDAEADEIRLAFRRLARLYHPDVAGTGDLARMRQINAAYDILSNPERRRQYDLSRPLPRPTMRPSPARDTPIHDTPVRDTTTRPAAGTGQAATRAGTLRHSPGPFTRAASLAADERVPITALAFARAGQLAATGLIDGRVLVWDVSTQRPRVALSFGDSAPAGVLQEVRLSPSGALAAAWGFLLGTRVWRVDANRPLWTTSANGPSGSMDAIVADTPEQIRLALPDAPLALAADDPFRWAHDGRYGTAVFTRPLASGPVDPAWAVPRRCPEVRDTSRAGAPSLNPWRVHQRLLSADGQRLLTFSTTITRASAAPGAASPRTGAFHLWDLEYRPVLGNPHPRRIARFPCPPGTSWLPLAATPDLSWVAIGYLDRFVCLLAPATGDQRVVPSGPLPADARAALSPDGALLALARGPRLDLWQTATAAHLQQWQLAADIGALSFATHSPTPLLAIGLANGLAELWR